MDALLEGLNKEQTKAVLHSTGPLLVVAGAGTGKTAVITRRIARLISSGSAKPNEILALTFTEKAAQEMSDRLFDLIGWQAMSVRVRTFNAFGAELIVSYAHHIGRPISGGLINDIQKALLLKQRINDLPLEYYGLHGNVYEFSERIIAYIGKLQNAGVSPQKYRKFVESLTSTPGDRHLGDIAEQRDLALLYEAYDELKVATSTYDYYDQLAIPLTIFEARPNLVQRLRNAFSYVLVDEYQDTSPVQDALLRLLVPKGGNIFAVGDDDQAIYSFRGAELGNIMAFRDHFGVEAPLALVENYRSGQPILDASYRLVRHNDPERLESILGLKKQLHAQSSEAIVKYLLYKTAADEEADVVSVIQKRIDEGVQSASDFAILARSNAVLKRYAHRLSEQNLPYSISTTMSIFEQREMIQLWSIMEWACHRASDDAISSIIMGPFVRWPAPRLRAIVERGKADMSSLEAALRSEAEDGNSDAEKLIEDLDSWRELAVTEPVTRFVYRLVFDYGLSDRLIENGAHDPRVIRIFEDLRRFMNQLQDYEATQLLQSIGDLEVNGYLDQFPKPPELEITETEGDANGIHLLTVHASKGLEFPIVFIVGVTNKSWSAQNSSGIDIPLELTRPVTENAELHEQRRLMYVAATRAKAELYVSSATETTAGTKQSYSPLIDELAGNSPLEKVASLSGSGVKTIDSSLRKLQLYYPLKSQLPDKLPFETSDGWIELGVGDMERFNDHPHDFYLQNVLGIVRPFGPQLSFGTAIHGAIQAFYEMQIRGEVIGTDELLMRLEELWSNRGYESSEQAALARERARTTLLKFREREISDPKCIQSTELSVRFEVPEAKLRLRGRIDATFTMKDGVEIRDFKTGNLKDAGKLLERTKKSFQLRTYALALKELSGEAPSLITLDYVVTNTIASFTPTKLILKNHRDKLITLAASLRNREFHPGTPSTFNTSAAFSYYGSESDGE